MRVSFGFGAVQLQKHTLFFFSLTHTDVGVCVIISKGLSFRPAKLKWQSFQIPLFLRGITVSEYRRKV